MGMKATLRFVVLCLLISLPAAAQEPAFQDALLDHFAGQWILEGTIAGAATTHDIEAEWVLGHHSPRFHEVSREKAPGGPTSEAIVFIGLDEPSGRYVCLWLDSTGGSGLKDGVFGYAERGAGELAFQFEIPDAGIFHTMFRYNKEDDSWQWLMDVEEGGKRSPFARLVMKRK